MEFKEFTRKRFPALNGFVSMTSYDDKFDFPIAFSKANTQIINNYEFVNSIDKFLPHCKDGTVYHKLLEIKQGIQVDTQYLEEQAQNL